MRFKLFLIFAFLTCTSSTVYAHPARELFEEGSAGVRGGGTGIKCDAAEVITLEQFESLQKNQSWHLSESRAEVFQQVQNQLKSNPRLLEAFSRVWNQFGPYTQWPKISKFPKALLETKITEYLNRNGTQIDSDLQSLVQDDFFDIPARCQKVSLSTLIEEAPYATAGIHLSEATQRALELHETFYSIGMNQYQHRLPVQTRRLIVAINQGSKKEITAALKEFALIAHSLYSALNEVFLLSGFSYQGKKPACPLAMSFSFDGRKQQVVTLVARDQNVSLVVRHPERFKKRNILQKMSYGLEQFSEFSFNCQGCEETMYFPEEKDAILPGGVNVFNGKILSNRDWKEFTYQNHLSVPKPSDAQTKPADRSEYLSSMCQYEKWQPELLNRPDVVKAWNQMIMGANRP